MCKNYSLNDFLNLSNKQQNPITKNKMELNNQHFNNSNPVLNPTQKLYQTSEIDMLHPNEIKNANDRHDVHYQQPPPQQYIQPPPQYQNHAQHYYPPQYNYKQDNYYPPPQIPQPQYSEPNTNPNIPQDKSQYKPIVNIPQFYPPYHFYYQQPKKYDDSEDKEINFRTKDGKSVKFKAKKERKPKIAKDIIKSNEEKNNNEQNNVEALPKLDN